MPQVVSSHVLCIPPLAGEMTVDILCPEAFWPGDGQEFTFAVLHDYPCELTVTIENEDGRAVYRFPTRQPSRPEQLRPDGSTFTWRGQTGSGAAAPAGRYRIRVRAYAAGSMWEVVSDLFLLAEGANG